MPDFATISLLLGKVAASYAFRKVASKGVAGLTAAIKRTAEEDGIKLTDHDFKTLRGLIKVGDTGAQAVFASLNPISSAGLIGVGPSGAGKTSIQNFFADNRLTTPTGTTTAQNPRTVRHGAWHYYIIDTPGQHEDAELREKAYEAVRTASARVLMLVFAGGFLKTLGTLDEDGSEILWKRPNRDPQPTRDAYLAQALDEEIAWLKVAKKQLATRTPRFEYAMVVVNKLDQWFAVRDRVKGYYEGTLTPADDRSNTDPLARHLTSARSKRFRAALDALVDGWCRTAAAPSFHFVSSQYDSLYNNPPSGEMSQVAAELSLRLLRAEVRLRFLEG